MSDEQASATETERSDQLRKDQRKDQQGPGAKDVKPRTKGERLLSIMKHEIHRSGDSGAFKFALLIALANDFADPIAEWAGTAVQPVVGTVMFSWLETLASWGLVAFTWWYLKSHGWFKDAEYQIRFIFWVGSFFLESIPLLKELPFHTMVVLYAWRDIQIKGQVARKWYARYQAAQATPAHA